jgi:hypothetical protein
VRHSHRLNVYVHDEYEGKRSERVKCHEERERETIEGIFVFFIKTEFVLQSYRQQKKTMLDIWHTKEMKR